MASSELRVITDAKDTKACSEFVRRIRGEGNKPEAWLEYLMTMKSSTEFTNYDLLKAHQEAVDHISRSQRDTEAFGMIMISYAQLLEVKSKKKAEKLYNQALRVGAKWSFVNVAVAQFHYMRGTPGLSRVTLLTAIEKKTEPTTMVHEALNRLDHGEGQLTKDLWDYYYHRDVLAIRRPSGRGSLSSGSESTHTVSIPHDIPRSVVEVSKAAYKYEGKDRSTDYSMLVGFPSARKAPTEAVHPPYPLPAKRRGEREYFDADKENVMMSNQFKEPVRKDMAMQKKIGFQVVHGTATQVNDSRPTPVAAARPSRMSQCEGGGRDMNTDHNLSHGFLNDGKGGASGLLPPMRVLARDSVNWEEEEDDEGEEGGSLRESEFNTHSTIPTLCNSSQVNSLASYRQSTLSALSEGSNVLVDSGKPPLPPNLLGMAKLKSSIVQPPVPTPQNPPVVTVQTKVKDATIPDSVSYSPFLPPDMFIPSPPLSHPLPALLRPCSPPPPFLPPKLISSSSLRIAHDNTVSSTLNARKQSGSTAYQQQQPRVLLKQQQQQLQQQQLHKEQQQNLLQQQQQQEKLCQQEKQLRQELSKKRQEPVQKVQADPAAVQADPVPVQADPVLVQTAVAPQLPMVTIAGKSYMVLSTIGKGGSSKVEKVVDPVTFQQYALKTVTLKGQPAESVACFMKEIELLKKLSDCDRVIHMYRHDYTNDIIRILLEMGEMDLESVLKQYNGKVIKHVTIAFYWAEMLEAVRHLHQVGIIHRDLKPANFMIVSGRVKLIDFGIAKIIQPDGTSLTLDSCFGTINFMAPEVLNDVGGPADPDEEDDRRSAAAKKKQYKVGVQSDVWSLGCILHCMAYGRTPFEHIRQLHLKVATIVNPAHEILFKDIGNENLVDTLKKCLVRNPKERSSIDELLKHSFVA